MSLRIVPADAHSGSFSHIAPRERGAPSAPGVHDLLRHGVGPRVAAPAVASASAAAAAGTTPTVAPESAHPLEARLRQWEATREALRMETLRRTFGAAEPVRRGMELAIARDGEWRPLALRAGASAMAVGGSGGAAARSVHEDILLGCEATLEWEDVFSGDELRTVPTMHEEMEKKLRM